MKTKNIKQTVKFKASPEEVFEALMDSKKHSKFTESKALISRKVGGKISAYDGYIQGKNLQIVKNKKIVQEWRGTAENWPEDHYSIASFELKKIPGGTKLTFIQKLVPEKEFESFKKGWEEHYWSKMKKMLEN